MPKGVYGNRGLNIDPVKKAVWREAYQKHKYEIKLRRVERELANPRVDNEEREKWSIQKALLRAKNKGEKVYQIEIGKHSAAIARALINAGYEVKFKSKHIKEGNLYWHGFTTEEKEKYMLNSGDFLHYLSKEKLEMYDYIVRALSDFVRESKFYFRESHGSIGKIGAISQHWLDNDPDLQKQRQKVYESKLHIIYLNLPYHRKEMLNLILKRYDLVFKEKNYRKRYIPLYIKDLNMLYTCIKLENG